MALRLVEANLPDVPWEEIRELLHEKPVLGLWHDEPEERLLHLRILISSDNASSVLDALERRFSGREGFQILVLPVEASIPRPETPEEKPPAGKVPRVFAVKERRPPRVVREELYADVDEAAKPCPSYLALMALSSIVAGIGILRDSDVLVIGAMVIAPLLGPNLGLALATTLADWRLGRRALLSLVIDVVFALGFSIVWGAVLRLDLSMPGIVQRTEVGPGDMVLALAAGSAAVLSLTSGAATTLVGVMVAVALLPPLVTCGLLLGSGHLWEAGNALLVFLTTIICINLAGVVTFVLQGVRPLTWWEAQSAKKATRVAVTIWILLLSSLLGIILLSQADLGSQ